MRGKVSVWGTGTVGVIEREGTYGVAGLLGVDLRELYHPVHQGGFGRVQPAVLALAGCAVGVLRAVISIFARAPTAVDVGVMPVRVLVVAGPRRRLVALCEGDHLVRGVLLIARGLRKEQRGERDGRSWEAHLLVDEKGNARLLPRVRGVFGGLVDASGQGGYGVRRIGGEGEGGRIGYQRRWRCDRTGGHEERKERTQ